MPQDLKLQVMDAAQRAPKEASEVDGTMDPLFSPCPSLTEHGTPPLFSTMHRLGFSFRLQWACH